MTIRRVLLGLVLVSTLSGCASITSDAFQPIKVSAASKQGQEVKGANCNLENDKGTWSVVTPDSVMVHRSDENLRVSCNKEGHDEGKALGVSRAAAGLYGNIIFGGGIGAIIDHNTGKGYNYPSRLPIVMGKKITVDRKDEQDEEKQPKEEVEQADKEAVKKDKIAGQKVEDQES